MYWLTGALGSPPSATTRRTMSRSVMMPWTRVPSQIGMTPVSISDIRRANVLDRVRRPGDLHIHGHGVFDFHRGSPGSVSFRTARNGRGSAHPARSRKNHTAASARATASVSSSAVGRGFWS
jgi:hypothetical protein